MVRPELRPFLEVLARMLAEDYMKREREGRNERPESVKLPHKRAAQRSAPLGHKTAKRAR